MRSARQRAVRMYPGVPARALVDEFIPGNEQALVQQAFEGYPWRR